MSAACAVTAFLHRSAVLAGNPLGDAVDREVVVLTPPGYDHADPRRYPTVYWLAGFGGRGRTLLTDAVFGPALPTRLGRAMDAGRAPRAFLVLPDCSTRYGGSQYLDSPACGRYLSYLVDELVPAVDARFPTVADRSGRAVVGKSSGGYGGLMAAMLRPGIFGAVAAHSPDAGFEFCYLALLPAVLDTIAARGGFAAFSDDPGSAAPHDAAFMEAMSLVAMAACYAPAPVTDLESVFPCDPRTGAFRPAVWREWRRHDPVRLVGAHAGRLAGLDFLFLDAGRADQYAMHWGARALHDALVRADVAHVYEEHPFGHDGIGHRFDRSLGLLTRQWSACAASPAS